MNRVLSRHQHDFLKTGLISDPESSPRCSQRRSGTCGVHDYVVAVVVEVSVGVDESEENAKRMKRVELRILGMMLRRFVLPLSSSLV